MCGALATQADVVVRFDQAPYWFTFWRGTSYIPHWVTENGIWYDNEFTETFPPGMVGSAEPMSDKQCRFSQVRILESSEARAVVHWRYAPLGVGYLPAYPDPLTDWADWTDEIHTIYPDGVGVRKIVVHTSKPDADREWHEGIVVMGPGMTPERRDRTDGRGDRQQPRRGGEHLLGEDDAAARSAATVPCGHSADQHAIALQAVRDRTMAGRSQIRRLLG